MLLELECAAQASSASGGHARNQSIEQQLTSAGNMRSRVRNASPIGDIARQMCRYCWHWSTKYAKSVVGEPSPSRPSSSARPRTSSTIAAFSSAGKRFGTSPAFNRPLMSSR